MAVEDLEGCGVDESNGSTITAHLTPANYTLKSPQFRVRRFEEIVMGQNIAVEVLKMKDSVYIWVGSASRNSQENMCLSIQTRFNPLPLSSPWIGDLDSTAPTSQKLCTKLKKPVVLSINIPDHHMVSHVEQMIFNDIKNNIEAY